MTTGGASTFFAGIEPHSALSKHPEEDLLHRERVSAGSLTHTVWLFRVLQGRLIRTWQRTPNGDVTTYYAMKRGGEVKTVEQALYQRLSRAMP